MKGQMYTRLPFYRSTNLKEFLDWKEQMEYELELQDFPEAKKVSQAALEFEDYAHEWWKKYPHKRFVKCWEDLKKAMRKEFVPREYELILLRRLKHIKQGSKSVQSYHDELSLAMRRANIVDDMVAKEYFMRGLNTNIVAAIKGKYARSVHNLLAYALKEEREIKELQQENISKCINLCKDIATRLHAELKPKVPFVVGSKQASTPCKKKRSIVTMCESMDANVKCIENKSIVVQQEDKREPQVDMGSDMMIDLSINSSGRTYPNVMVVQNFSLDSDFEKTEVNEVLSNDCLKSEHEPFGDVVAHTVQDENEQCHNHLQTREIIESKKEVVAADFQSEGAYFVQQEHEETYSQVQILRADVPTSSMPFSSAIYGEIKCYNVIDSSDM
jgi:hypothetical protein